MRLPPRNETDLRKVIDAIYTLSERRWIVLAASAVAASVTATTSEEELATVRIPADSMGPNGVLRITTLWTYTNSANNKLLKVRFSGISGTAYMANTETTTAFRSDQRKIHNRGSRSSQGGGASGVTAFGTGTGAPVTSAVDTTVETTLSITGQKASAGETLTLENYLVELYAG